ncbi:MAG: hypothetical protein KAQ65_06930, partial [Candidatus Thorarchaeota archaeon]|nr:hypothetical protein [Candidatus Thorarchaeota archaeon]
VAAISASKEGATTSLSSTCGKRKSPSAIFLCSRFSNLSDYCASISLTYHVFVVAGVEPQTSPF